MKIKIGKFKTRIRLTKELKQLWIMYQQANIFKQELQRFTGKLLY